MDREQHRQPGQEVFFPLSSEFQSQTLEARISAIGLERASIQEAKLLEDFQTLRTEYVGKVMNWLDFNDGEKDTDRYDQNKKTVYLIATRVLDGQERAYVGLRLTRLSCLDEALSIEMWQGQRDRANSEIHRQFQEAKPKLDKLDQQARDAAGAGVYDITRLVPLIAVEGLKGESRAEAALKTHQAIVRLIGAIAGIVGLDARVVFTSTPAFLQSLRRAGFPLEILVSGEISPDKNEGKSFLCTGIMRQGWYDINNDPEQAKLFAQGYASVVGEVPSRVF